MHKSEYMEMLNVPHGKYSSLPRLSNQWGLKTLVVPDFKFTKDFLLFFTQIFSNILNHIELYCGLCKKGVRFHKSTQSYLSLNPPKQIHQWKYWQQIYDEKLNSAAGHMDTGFHQIYDSISRRRRVNTAPIWYQLDLWCIACVLWQQNVGVSLTFGL